ncbi:MAG: hypothetical protein MUP44_06405, partial [Anaerolineales bacterium]|nr:hypothetical protein [Anaerolineales bacterium]
MAEQELSAPPADDTTPLPTATVTQSREIVMPSGSEQSSENIGKSLSEAFDEAERDKAERDAEESAESEQSIKKPKEDAEKPTPEDTPEVAAEETDPRKIAAKMIEEEGKGAEEPEVPEVPAQPEEAPVEFPEGVKSQKAKDRYIELSHRVKEAETAREALRKEKEAVEAKFKELEARQPQASPEEQKAARESVENELLQLRRQYQLDNDPAVKQKFDGVVEDSEKRIITTLKKHGLREDWQKIIESEGGFENFSASKKVAQMPDGETTTYAEMADNWLTEIKRIDVRDSRSIAAAIDEQIRTKTAKERFIVEEKGKAKEWFESQQKTYQSSVEQQQKAAQEQKQKVESFVTRATTETPWMKDIEIPATATPEEKKELEKDKQFRKALRDNLKITFQSQSIEDLL